jgi:VWFA-related protein
VKAFSECLGFRSDGREFMVTHARLGIFLLAPLLSASTTLAQQNPPPAPPSNSRIYLDVVVTPNSGPPVAGLQQQDFTLLDNKAPQAITSFQAFSGSEAPVSVILVIDAVNTGYETIAYERNEIDKFLRANGGRLAHPTALAIITDTGSQIQQDFSTDGAAVSAAFDKYAIGLRDLRRSAGFYGAVERLQLSLQALSQLAAREAPLPGRKIVLWVSPGWPFLSGPRVVYDSKQERQIFDNIVSVTTQLRAARVTLYSIDPRGTNASETSVFYYQEFLKGVTKPSQASAGNLGLQVLATQTGGLVFHSSNDVSGLLQQCVADAQAWYEISFDPPRGEPDEYHHLEVRVAKPGLIARTRQSYYSLPLQPH